MLGKGQFKQGGPASPSEGVMCELHSEWQGGASHVRKGCCPEEVPGLWPRQPEGPVHSDTRYHGRFQQTESGLD